MSASASHTADYAAEIDGLLRGWALSDAERALLRGHNESAEQQAVRLTRLRTIVGGLYLLFPENPDLRRDWVQRVNAELGGHSPVQVILADDDGLRTIARLIHAQLQQ